MYPVYFLDENVIDITCLHVITDVINIVLFFSSCFDHCDGLDIGTWPTTLINGHNASQYAANWFWERNELPRIMMDDCVSDDRLSCNPTCLRYLY